MKIIVTGGAGFIGSALVRHLVNSGCHQILTVDCLTYAGSVENLREVQNNARFLFKQSDIRDRPALDRIFATFQPDAIFHLAAQTHVDRSIDDPAGFVSTNVMGTCTLLEAVRAYLLDSGRQRSGSFRFVHVSTDEVFGSLEAEGFFTEDMPYDPSSPYSASKASADHLVRAWYRTFGLPVIVGNCSNNYGPYQYPEKLIPMVIRNAVHGKKVPVYGTGSNVRDWLFVEDHISALVLLLEGGRVGETYAIGGNSLRRNIDVVKAVCNMLDDLLPSSAHKPHEQLIQFVTDRPGHDFRYAIDSSKIERELGWTRMESFESGLLKTVEWYLANESWCGQVTSGKYDGGRLGLPAANRETANET